VISATNTLQLKELGLRFGRCTEDAKLLLKEQGNDSPTTAQLKKVLDKIEDEHHAILFLYKADKTRYGKYVKQVENNMLEKMKDHFPKTVADACQILAGWHNVYGHNPKHTEANYGVAFATTGNTEEKETEKRNKKDKKKNITCFKCKEKKVTILMNVLMMKRITKMGRVS